MIECKDPYAPIKPGSKGTIDYIDDIGTLHMTWDDGRTLGVCLEEDVVELVPIDEEYVSVTPTKAHEHPDEHVFESHQERVFASISQMDSSALSLNSAWVVRRRFLDSAHRSQAPEYLFVEAGDLNKLIDRTDSKNGVDAGVHEAGDCHSFVMIAHGANYSSASGEAHVCEAFECRLLKREVADDYRDRMVNAGWSEHGIGPERMFFSSNDQLPLPE